MKVQNNYIIVSNDQLTIDVKINEIIKKINIKDLEIIKYDYKEVPINTMLEDINTYNLLASSKLIIYTDCLFLEKSCDKDFKYISEYLKNPSDNYLVMISSSLSDRKEIKDILEFVEVVNTNVNIDTLIKNNLEDFTMDNRTINYYINYCLGNNQKILTELEKLKCYKYSDSNKNITIDDINSIVLKDYDEDVFTLANAIAAKNKDKAFSIYSRLKNKEKDSVNIIASVSVGIRNLYSVKVLSEKGYKQSEISSILDIKPYAVEKALMNCGNYSTKKLLSLLNDLADVDFRCKSEYGRDNAIFELFLLSL